MPSRDTHPPERTDRVAATTAAEAPLISSAQSTSPPAARRTSASVLPSPASMRASAPILPASSRRYRLGSTAMTRAAPRALATATAAQPIGPQPKTATVRPSSSP